MNRELQSIISQLERQRAAIERALEALRDIEGPGTAAAPQRRRPPAQKRGRKQRVSVGGRARIGEATRKRLANKRAAEAGASAKNPSGPRAQKKRKRSMSPEGRARIAEAARETWATRKKARKNAA